MAGVASKTQAVDKSCAFYSFLADHNLSPSFFSLNLPERRDAFTCWLASRVLNLDNDRQEKLIQCPFGLCCQSFGDSSSTLKHSFSCTKWRCGEYACSACSQLESIFKSPEISIQSIFDFAPEHQDINTDLRSIGDQFDAAGYPPQTDFSKVESECARVPDIIVSTSSLGSNQANTTPISWYVRGPSSDHNFKPACNTVSVPARSVKSDSYLYANENALGTQILLPRYDSISNEVNKHRDNPRKSAEPSPDLLASSVYQPLMHTPNSIEPSSLHSCTRRVRKRRSLASLTLSTRTSATSPETSEVDPFAAIKDWSKCPECPTQFTKSAEQKRSLKRHFKSHHQLLEPIECPDENCRRTYTTAWNCQRHMKQDHPSLISSTYTGDRKSRIHAQGLSRSHSQ